MRPRKKRANTLTKRRCNMGQNTHIMQDIQGETAADDESLFIRASAMHDHLIGLLRAAEKELSANPDRESINWPLVHAIRAALDKHEAWFERAPQ